VVLAMALVEPATVERRARQAAVGSATLAAGRGAKVHQDESHPAVVPLDGMMQQVSLNGMMQQVPLA
jgi:hypothetical protein